MTQEELKALEKLQLPDNYDLEVPLAARYAANDYVGRIGYSPTIGWFVLANEGDRLRLVWQEQDLKKPYPAPQVTVGPKALRYRDGTV